MPTMTGGEALARQLLREGITDLFAVPGVQLDWAFDAFAALGDELKVWVPRHEQATTYMADGYARAGVRAGASLVVPGPGALNALAGLSTAYACSSRLLFLAGQVASERMGRGHGVLHELPDQSGILQRLAKWYGLASSPAQIPELVREAVHQLGSGRPRPAALELPQDVLQRTQDVDLREPTGPALLAPDQAQVSRAATLLASARFPVVVAGGGVLAAGASRALARLAETLQAPVLMTENGTGALPSLHPLALPWLGSRSILRHADVVIAVGTRFMESGVKPPALRPNATLILVNAEAADLDAPRQSMLTLHADARLALDAIADELGGSKAADRSGAVRSVRSWCDALLADYIAPQRTWIDALRAAIPDDGFLVPDLTQVGYPAHLAYPVREPGTFIGAGYQGTLGFAYPTALGVAAAQPTRAVVSVSGDGGFGWALQELATARRYKLPVTAVVFVDGWFGNVRLLQQRQFGRTFAAELVNPDFVRLAESFGVNATRVATPAALRGALAESVAGSAPGLIEVTVGEFPSPWHLVRSTVPSPRPAPADPLGESA